VPKFQSKHHEWKTEHLNREVLQSNVFEIAVFHNNKIISFLYCLMWISLKWIEDVYFRALSNELYRILAWMKEVILSRDVCCTVPWITSFRMEYLQFKEIICSNAIER
jgi:hypothetical protein